MILLTGLYYAQPARAFYAEWAEHNWIYFNGCSIETCLDAIPNENWKDDTYFSVGDFNVKQGVYQIWDKESNSIDGKFMLKFNYRFLTEEDADSEEDVGYMKVKDVDTDEVYYLKTVTPKSSATTEWTPVKIVLPIEYAAKKLQVVFEASNNSDKLSLLNINTIQMGVWEKPNIQGGVYHTVLGKEYAAINAKVELQNRKGTKVIETLYTDQYGFFKFSSVPKHKKMKVVVNYQGEEQTLNVKKMHWGDREDLHFVFEQIFL